ncbi:hypothetical protein SLEP1_g14107 [Rubroshorea leprosula]|uniref:Uncharacterized protein n=1 Tax=Rubroshorea leprosula TaxID=152421 RepID=A0AAV5IRT6_9ROSI|nr:hypothetical protein SLEP1_g14107 [Rubroshorea leprosula]
MLIYTWKGDMRHQGSFKFCDTWSLHPRFLPMVSEKEFSDLEGRISIISSLFLLLQQSLAVFPSDEILLAQEKALKAEHRKLVLAKNSLLVQLSKVKLLQNNDLNTKYFHARPNVRRAKYFIGAICDDHGNRRKNEDDFKQNHGLLINNSNSFWPQTPVSKEEIKNAMFSIPNKKAGFWLDTKLENPRPRARLLRSSKSQPKFSASQPSPTPPALPFLSAVSDLRCCSVALCFLQLLICSPHRTCSLPSANALSPELLSALTEPKLLSTFC